ncbi:DUF924 domain-containing protein [Kaistia dalseonensis]|uniref:Uncharacterized protein (DUF924 family) n=1 Tax=Kaistia dalseonensis TaxID=410840 RepID=A0ABU0HAE1_9HYPH|nr:DUF924 family protein [Kaistia dalseonensis]MCX5496338.1 DUF924 domain-containing protein [Kaistia dalseonensis]MDQ0438957.1 uncharacterized protein (DUF924 family) [Kaistia dalseonensis]
MPDADSLVAAHRYWCGHLVYPTDYPAEKSAIWFERKDETDDYIRATFGPDLDRVAATDWPLDAMSREARIGLVIYLDQFPRNMFRADARAYAYDARARSIAHALVAAGVEEYGLIERSFLYLPFEHSEDLADQQLSVRLYEALLAAAPADQIPIYENFVAFAIKHRELIERFGRFPHRNADLGRVSTPDEVAFLEANGRGY